MRVVLLSGLVAVACTSVSGRIPDRLVGVPWLGAPGDDAVLAAREAFERGDSTAAFAAVGEVLAEHPRHVDAHRLRQDLLRQRGRIGLVLEEAERRVRDWAGDPSALYLRGRVALHDSDKLRDFHEAVARQRDLFWAWLGLAFTVRDSRPDESLSIYERMFSATQGHPLVAIALAATLRARKRYPEALHVYSGLRDSELLPGVGDLGVAETYVAAERRVEAWPPLLQALRARPWDAGARRLVDAFVGAGLPNERAQQALDVLYERPERLEQFGRDDGALLLATLLERRGNLPAAREVLVSARAPRTAAAQRHWRRLRLATGDVAGFLAATRDAMPDYLLADEENQVRGLWVRLLRGPWASAEDPLADIGHGVALVEALLHAGMLEESDMVATLALERHRRASEADVARLTGMRSEARRELAFEGAVRRLVYQGYGGSRDFSLTVLLEHVRRVSVEILGEDVVGEVSTFRVPFVGELVDPFGGGLAEHFARYNKHLVLGQRAGAPSEGLLLTRLSLRYLEPSDEIPLAGRCWQVVCDDRQITSLRGVLGGDIAGVALLNHYVVDLDAVRDWAAGIVERRAIVRGDGDALLDDPLPERVDALHPVDVHWRLIRLSPVEDTEVEHAVFDMVCRHERAHLADSFRFLPPEQNLWRVLGLAFGHGFNAFSIESEMEGRAELAALAFSPHTELVLAHIAGFLEEDAAAAGSPHVAGFRRLARRLNQALAADPDNARNATVSRWHLVPPECMRAIARAIVAQS